MIEGAIFDIDGTLLDSMKIWEDCSKIFLSKHGIEAEPGLDEMMETMTLLEGADYLKEHYHLDMTQKEIIDGNLEVVGDFYKNEVVTKPGAKELVLDLYEQKIPMTIATSSDGELVSEALKRLGILHCFHTILTSHELETTKKEPFIYQEAARIMGAEVQKTVVFEDAYFAVETAAKAGFPVVAIHDCSADSCEDDISAIADLYVEDFYEKDRLNSFFASI